MADRSAEYAVQIKVKSIAHHQMIYTAAIIPGRGILLRSFPWAEI